MKKLIRITTIATSLDSFVGKQLSFLNKDYDVIALANGVKILEKLSKTQNIKVLNVDMKREITPIYDFISLTKLVRVFLQEKPYIVHANTPKASLLSMVAAKICGVPNRLYTVTGLRFETTSGVFRKLLLMMEKITCYCATKVIPEGEGVRKTLLRDKITKKPLSVIHNGNINGIDTTFYALSSVIDTAIELRQRLNIERSSFVFVFVGRLVKDKGINELIDAFERLYEINQTITLLLVGSYEEKLDPLAPETLIAIKSHNAIKHVGYQNDVRPYFKAADALVFPSYREGFPNVVMQAGAMELPSIVTDINGCNEIIIDNTNGVIIPPQDADALFSAMKKFIDNPEAVSRMAEKSRPLIQSRYEQQDVWNAILEMYKSLD